MKTLSSLSCLSIGLLMAGSVLADQYVSTGANVRPLDGSEIYTWTDTNSVGTIVIPEGGALFDVLLVGGGGAGGYCRGGGGGGGGVVYKAGVFFEAGTYTISVGKGGVPDKWPGKSSNAPASTATTDGGPTTISSATAEILIAYGGGGGATFKSGAGRAGASSGGSAAQNAISPAGVDGQGNHGGSSCPSKNECGGGGGGAGTPGGDADVSVCGNGGDGRLCTISGTNAWYGAGGGGGTYNKSSVSGAGGLGGGGHGGVRTNADLTAGADGVGAGGGGASGYDNKEVNCGGARGGSGIVILRSTTVLQPAFSEVQVEVSDSTNVTFSAVLQEVGTDPEGTALASGCDLYLAYGPDPEALVSVKVKTGWTLDDPRWSMTVTDIPAFTKFYWRAALTNDLGAGAESVQSGQGATTGPGTPLPVKYELSDPTAMLSASGLGNYELPALVDGDFTRGCVLANTTKDVLFDVGEPKTVRMFRAYSLDNADTTRNTLKDFELYGSNDRSDWVKITSADDFIGGFKSQEWMEAVVSSAAPYRYYEMRGVLGVRLGEVELISNDAALRFDKPVLYVRSAGSTFEELDAEYDPEGVTVSGQLVSSPLENVSIYGYSAAKDYDADEDAWKSGGEKFEIAGTFSAGDSFSQKVQLAGRGTRYIRLFAKIGDQTVSANRSWEIALKSREKLCPAYVHASTDQRHPTTQYAQYYNGDTSDGPDQGGSTAYVIFDLRGLAPSEFVSHLRIWPRVEGRTPYTWTRTRVGSISVSYDQAEIIPTSETLVEGREVFLYDAEPAVTWTTVKPYLNDLVDIHSLADSQYLDLPKKPRPTFLKIGGFSYNNTREIQIRVVDRDQGLRILVR